MFFPVASLRGSVVPEFENGLFIPRDRRLSASTLIAGAVTAVAPKARTVTYTPSGGGASVTISYDILVLATGISYTGPVAAAHAATVADARAAYKATQAAVASAKNILIIGGGPIGIELAGEIKAAPGGDAKSVTIAHSGAHLISSSVNGNVATDASLGSALAKTLERVGVKVLVNTRVLGSGRDDSAAAAAGLRVVGAGIYAGAASLTTSSGTQISADLQIWVNGAARPNTGFLSGSGVPLDAAGYVAVEPTLQVKGQPLIFAIGDVASTTHAKTLMTAVMAHVPGVVPNIHAAARAGSSLIEAAVLKPVKPLGFTAMLVPVGPQAGNGRVFSFVFGDWFAKMKGGDLFLAKTYKEHKYTEAEVRAAASKVAA